MTTTLASLVGDRALRQGDSGETVRAVQIALRSLGYPLRGTGQFGGATDTAVTTFQRRAGLKTDGEVGRLTATALDVALSGLSAAPSVVPGSGQPLWLETGFSLAGTREGAGALDNQTIIDWARDEGGDVARAYTHDSIPWCALFENHIFSKNGIRGTGTLWALDWAGKWPSIRLSGPAVGAVAPMLRAGGGHVTNVVGVDQHGNVMGLGGNQSDAVNVKPFARSRLNQGFWWPASVPPPALVGYEHLPVVRSDGSVSSSEA